ncbi:MAG: glycosyltransferase family 1 protein [Bradyrhizobiaceae bacterium]|nr:MAG: glycosyltransferase family 1 protein [Bradyrhizobiaceae bacterium]
MADAPCPRHRCRTSKIKTSNESTRPLRILQILHTQERGGILTLASMIEDGLTRHGCEVETAILFRTPDRNGAEKIADAARMAARLLRGGYDALISYQATASILVGLFGRIRGCKTRIVHQTAVPSATAPYLRIADKIAGSLGFYTANVVNTRFTLNEFKSYPAAYQRRIVLNEHGIEPPVPTQDREQTRAQFDIPQNSPVLLHVGRLVAQKNQKVIVQALAQLPDVIFVVAGHGEDERAIMDLAQAEGVAERAHLLGARGDTDIANLYAASDLFVFPSVWETFGLAAAEAAISGIAMIVSDIPVLREVLASGNSPVIFADKDDSAAWTEAIRKTLDHPIDVGQLKSFSQDVAARYSVQRMIDHYLQMLGMEQSAREARDA